MSNLVTITAKFYDKSGQSFGHLNVQSRYQGSSKANTQKADSNGLFVFQASPHRKVELLAKPQNQKDYTVFKTIDSSLASSAENPVKVQLPKTIEEYKQSKQPSSAKGIVSTFFKVVDSNGKIMKNFPVQSRPKGKGNSPDKFTDDQGIVEVKSSPNRDIEVLVLTSSDQFVLKSSMNSGNGNEEPILIKLDEPYAKFLSRSMIKILDRDGNDYVIEKTNVEMLIVESGRKQLYSISNGKLALQSMVGQKLEFTVYKPDGKPLKPQTYMATRIKNNPAELHLDVDVTKGTTAANDPEINRAIQGKVLCKKCGKSLNIDLDFIKDIAPKAKPNFQKALLLLPIYLKKYSSNTCKDLVHILAQGKIETQDFIALIESMKYTKKSYTGKSLYNMMKTNFENAFKRHGMDKSSLEQRYKYVEDNFISNDPAIAQFLYSVPEHPNKNYRGRGLIHLTHFSTYVKCAKETGLDIENNPELLQYDFNAAIESATWFWNENRINKITTLDNDKIDDVQITNKITVKVNIGMKQATERRVAKIKIANKFINKYGECK